MLKGLRERIKRLPVIGPAMHHLYLTAAYHEGKVETIRDGMFKGMKFRRFMHTFSQSYIGRDYEIELQGVFIALIKPGQVVYDLGENVGFMTLPASKLVGPPGTVIALEPSRLTARQLRAQVDVNHLKNMVVEEYAVAEVVGTADFIVEEFSVMARLEKVGEVDGKKLRTQSVRTTTLDHMIGIHKAPQLLKIDIEGAELLALAGAARLIEEFRPILVVELHSEDLSRRFLALMHEKRYEVALPNGEKALPEVYSRFVVAKPLPSSIVPIRSDSSRLPLRAL
jgi:FkbM family methyltransferase